jgi:beta-mannosidase
MKQRWVLSSGWRLLDEEGNYYSIPKMPMQVHSILRENGVISNRYIWGDTQDCRWVQEKKWIYEVEFSFDHDPKHTYLCAPGVDTFADFYLNGHLIGSCEDFYLPYRFPVADYLQNQNVLRVVFRSAPEEIRNAAARNPHPDKIPDFRMIRKNFHDFTSYLGAKPDLMKVGLFDEVFLEKEDVCAIKDFHVSYTLNDALNQVQVWTHTEVTHPCSSRLEVWGPDGKPVYSKKSDEVNHSFCIDRPALWYPKGYGSQALYRFRLELLGEDESVYDAKELQIGFRKVESMGMLNFWINQHPVKLYGGNITPPDGETACIDEQRVKKLLELAERCNMNTLRVWGEGERLPDFFYDLADQKGILIWQEFFSGNSAYPNDFHLRSLIRQEAETLVKRLRNHPSLLLWCGGNECYLNRDFGYPGEEYFGSEIIEQDYREICAKLDSGRYYHVNSPFGGAYSNDPSAGDTHSYTNTWFVPGGDYPVFVSENLRVALPKPDSMVDYLEGNLPDQITSFMKDGNDFPWPEEWNELTSADSYYKIPPVEQFYDADDLDSLCYRFGAAAGAYLRETVERYRRGKPVWDCKGPRRCNGHFVWKLNTTRPHLYSSILDYYLEPYIPYYALKRAYEPVQISFEVGDHIYVWIVNDSVKTISGQLELGLFDLEQNTWEKKKTVPVLVNAGESELIGTLDDFGQFLRKRAMVGRLHAEHTEVTAIAFADIERHLSFPDPRLSLTVEENQIRVKSDQFAHCVELSAEENGDRRDFYFSDNYFDLLPGEEKVVELITPHQEGNIYAKTHYGKDSTTAVYRRK